MPSAFFPRKYKNEWLPQIVGLAALGQRLALWVGSALWPASGAGAGAGPAARRPGGIRGGASAANRPARTPRQRPRVDHGVIRAGDASEADRGVRRRERRRVRDAPARDPPRRHLS